ncbi:MAG: M20 family metallo-hydrolase [Desulfovibrio sp.]|jgi:succinyl-diaminopimelate desuccinylase|nr:M20 family metallo-hydrolase [Desulfovibrio sp.]
MLETLYAFLDSSRDQIVLWQRSLTARPALGPENGGEGERQKADWLHQELTALGLSDIRSYPCPDHRVPCGFRPNISARVQGKGGPTLWVISHLDVVPPGDNALWTHPPFELHVLADHVYGRGVEDNHQGIVSSLLAARALLNCGITPDISLGLLFVADEETGMSHGLPYVLGADPHLIAPDDLCLVPDMGNATGSMVEIVEKSVLWLRFTVLGAQSHASRPSDGVNSLVAASACILALDALHRTFNEQDLRFLPAGSTFVPSKKEANVENINTLPGKDVFYMDCRVVPGYPLERILEETRRIAETVARQYGARIEVDPVHAVQAPPATPDNAPVVRRLLSALAELRGIAGELRGSGGLTEANCLRACGRQAVAWATLEGNAHSGDESSSILATVADAKVIARMLFS